MKFYKITKVKPPSLYGTIPQSQRMTEGYDYTKINSVKNISKVNKIDVIPNFSSIQLEYRAKLTDWIPSINVLSSSVYLIVSKKLKAIIEPYILESNFQIFNADVVWRKKSYEYFCIYSWDKSLDFIDFESTKFDKKKIVGPDFIETFTIKNQENYMNEVLKGLKLEEDPYTIIPKSILIKKDIEIDIFRFGIFPYGYYVSERLKKAIVEAKCTGISFTSIEELSLDY